MKSNLKTNEELRNQGGKKRPKKLFGAFILMKKVDYSDETQQNVACYDRNTWSVSGLVLQNLTCTGGFAIKQNMF